MMRLAPLFAACAALAGAARADGGDARWLERAIAEAPAGATLVVPAGEYAVADIRIRRNIVLRGEGEVTLIPSRAVDKGLLNPVDGASLTVENIVFRGARSPDRNGAGIRHDGRHLTILDCRFEGNENGVLFTGDEDGRIRIERSAFVGSGHGDGYSHGVYVNAADSLEIRDSRFSGTKIGHHVKSLARRTVVAASSFDDTTGGASYALDASRGGDVSFIGNSVIKSASADNPAIVNYDLTRGGAAVALVVADNRIVNRHPNARLVRNATDIAAAISGNDVINQAGGRLDPGASGGG